MPRKSARLSPGALDPTDVKTPDILMAELAARYIREHPDADPAKATDPLYALYCLAMSDGTPVDQKRMAFAELAKYQQPAVRPVEVGVTGAKGKGVHVTLKT